MWLCHHEGLRKIEPSLLKWAGRALAAAAADYRAQHGRAPDSITELSAAAVVRQAVLVFERRNARLPSAGLTAKDTQIADLKAALRERDRTISVLHGELDKLHAAGG